MLLFWEIDQNELLIPKSNLKKWKNIIKDKITHLTYKINANKLVVCKIKIINKIDVLLISIFFSKKLVCQKKRKKKGTDLIICVLRSAQ